MIALVVTSIVDISIVKINDLIDKYFIPLQAKLGLFAVNSSVCLLLQFLLIRYIHGSFQRDRLSKTLKVKAVSLVSIISLSLLASLKGYLILQQFYNNYYDTSISITLIVISYGTAAGLLGWLSSLFLSWYRSSHNLIVHFNFDNCI